LLIIKQRRHEAYHSIGELFENLKQRRIEDDHSKGELW
jgi:HEPN domain-containing protein